MECSFGNTLRCSFDTLRFAPRQQCGRLNPNSSSFLSFNSSPILAQVTSIYIHIFYVQSTLFKLTLLHVIQTQFFNFRRIWVLLLPLFHGGLFGLEQKWRRRRVRLTAAIGCWSNTNTLRLNFNFLEFFCWIESERCEFWFWFQVFVPPHPLIKHWISVLRNDQTPCPVFSE